MGGGSGNDESEEKEKVYQCKGEKGLEQQDLKKKQQQPSESQIFRDSIRSGDEEGKSERLQQVSLM